MTNQPHFSINTEYCDNFVRLFNTSVSLPPYTPTPVRGSVSAAAPFFAEASVWRDVEGLLVDNAFIENNYLACETLEGLSGADGRRN